MKTNYNNLTSFEACIVIVAVVGLTLIGWEIYMSLPHQHQTQVSEVLSMFDMHDEFAHVHTGASFAMASMNEFYKQFDIAFEQTFSYPDQFGTPVMKFAHAVDTYSTQFALNYEQNIQTSQDYNAGNMLSSLIASSQDEATAAAPSGQVSGSSTSKFEIYKQYYYHAPGVVKNILK